MAKKDNRIEDLQKDIAEIQKSKSKPLNILPFVSMFDTALAMSEEREFKARNYMYASEIGMGMYDRYLSMMGTYPSNLPNEIAIRKFKIGNMIEDFFKLVLYEVGLLHAHEERVMSNFDFGCTVSGRLDILYGGKFNFQDIGDSLGRLRFLSFIGILSKAIKEFAERNKNVEYSITGLEIKSVSDYMYNKIDSRGTPEPHHALQSFHYAYWKQIPFLIVYFDKNNGRIKEFWIMPDDKELYSLYCSDIVKMSNYYNTRSIPPKEGLISFSNDRFSENWNVLYSKYLTAEYGFGSKEAYKNFVGPTIGRWNRVMGRIKGEKELTKDNISAIEEMRKAGFNIDLPETIDIQHEEVKPKETSVDKLQNLKNILGKK